MALRKKTENQRFPITDSTHSPIDNGAYIKTLSLFTRLHGLQIEEDQLLHAWHKATLLAEKHPHTPHSDSLQQLSLDYPLPFSAQEKIAYTLQQSLNALKFDAHIRFGTVQKLLRSSYPLIMIDQQSEPMVLEGIQNELLLLKGSRKIAPIPLTHFHKIFSNLWVNANIKTRSDKSVNKALKKNS